MQAPPPTQSPLAHYRLLSPTAGVRVSPLCLGSMSLGTEWKAILGDCSKEEAFKILDHYYEKGGNFIDTANAYQNGESEVWLGEWLTARKNRDEIVLATKYTGPLPIASAKLRVNLAGNHIKSLLLSFEASLAKLQTTYVDILYIHWWDFSTSIPEVMQSLNRLVNAGKVHYLGISDSPAWIALKANLYAEQHGMAQFSVYQGMYSAADRDCEREILPVCEDTGMAFTAYGALGGGRFKTKEQAEKIGGEGRNLKGKSDAERYAWVTATLEEIAGNKGVKITQVALAYALHKAPYVFPVVGCRKLEYLEDAIAALTIKLDDDDMDKIDRSSKFEPGFPISFIFQQFNTDISYKPSMTTKDVALAHRVGRLDIVEKAKPIPPHDAREYEAKE